MRWILGLRAIAARRGRLFPPGGGAVPDDRRARCGLRLGGGSHVVVRKDLRAFFGAIVNAGGFTTRDGTWNLAGSGGVNPPRP